MRTTIDIPEELFKATKIKAVQEGVPLRTILTRALEREFAAPHTETVARKERAQRLFAALDKARNTKPVASLNREETYDRTVLRRH